MQENEKLRGAGDMTIDQFVECPTGQVNFGPLRDFVPTMQRHFSGIITSLIFQITGSSSCSVPEAWVGCIEMPGNKKGRRPSFS
jgi:hypothetical protein